MFAQTAEHALSTVELGLAPQGGRILFAAGAQIFKQGDLGNCAYLVEEGYVEISTLADGAKKVVALLGPGELFGEMAPIDGCARSATATALHETVVTPVTRQQLDDAIQDSNPLTQLLIRAALGRLRNRHRPRQGDSASEAGADLLYQAARERAAEHIRLRAELHDAIEGRQLALHFQPIISLTDGRTAGHEALVRWPRATGMVPPAEFIPLAEETGLIVPLGLWVLETALQSLARVHRHQAQARPGRDPLFISVNVSPRQLLSPADLERIAAVIESAEVDPAYVKLEITEQILLADPAVAAARLARLKATGVKIAIDDFGTGYSSLNYLHRFPLDILKIDRSFVNTITREPSAQRVVAAVLDLARGLHMDVVAEGIEERDEFVWLQAHGCRFGQGYLMAKPMPFSEALLRLNHGFEW